MQYTALFYHRYICAMGFSPITEFQVIFEKEEVAEMKSFGSPGNFSYKFPNCIYKKLVSINQIALNTSY